MTIYIIKIYLLMTANAILKMHFALILISNIEAGQTIVKACFFVCFNGRCHNCFKLVLLFYFSNHFGRKFSSTSHSFLYFQEYSKKLLNMLLYQAIYFIIQQFTYMGMILLKYVFRLCYWFWIIMILFSFLFSPFSFILKHFSSIFFYKTNYFTSKFKHIKLL